MSKHRLNINYSKCDLCQACVNACPVDAIEVSDGRVDLSRPEDCMACSLCETVCPQGCIQMIPGS